MIDAANGSAAVVIDKLVTMLHLNADIINNHPNGTNINDMCGSTHIGALVKRMKTNGYDYGLAFDGDADRLLLIDHQGQTINGTPWCTFRPSMRWNPGA
jgi:phosphoglucosamine mutase